MKEVDRLDTTPRHAAMLLKELEVIDESISCAEAPTRDLFMDCFDCHSGCWVLITDQGENATQSFISRRPINTMLLRHEPAVMCWTL